MIGKRLKESRNEPIGFVTSIEDPETKDEQKLTSILTDRIDSHVKAAGYNMIWFVEYLNELRQRPKREIFFYAKPENTWFVKRIILIKQLNFGTRVHPND